jgi:hypothetical protein
MALTSEQITDYASLQTQIENVLNRDDIDADAPLLIQLAEQALARDERCRKLQYKGTFSIAAEGDSLPADYDHLEDWYHDGPTYYGPIEIVPANVLPIYNAKYGGSGVPRVAAVIEGAVYYGPSTDGAYSTTMSYWRKILPLSTTQTTNWLLLDSPDIYLFAALAEAEPFLKNDSRVALWQSKLERALEMLDSETKRKQFSGKMVRRIRPRRVIGG